MTNTITAGEIREIREQYGLTQKAFAQLLGIGQASMVRYENGSVPSRANANLIRAARHPEFMLECIERDGDAIPAVQRENATRIAYAFISLDPVEGEVAQSAHAQVPRARSKMDEVYHYTLQQEVLNEQAANLIGELISIKVSTGFLGPASYVYEELLNQLAELKPTIVSSATRDDSVLASIRGYLECAAELIVRRQREVA